MKRTPLILFPPFFAALTLALFLFFYRPAPAAAGMTSACLVFLTALSWSTMIVCGRSPQRGLKRAYVLPALLFSLIIVGPLPLFPVRPLSHFLMIGFQALGAAGIALYLRILRKKEENPR